MNNSLLKKIVSAGGALLAFVMVLVSKVAIRLTMGEETSNPLYKGFFEFMGDSKKTGMYSFARVMMIIGFIMVCISVIYFICILVLSLLKKDKLLNKLTLITKIMEFVIIGAMFVILIAGFDKETYGGDVMVNNITLFSFPFFLAMLFSVLPLASEYLIKNK